MKLNGKVGIVIGGGSGIGLAISEMFAKEGANVTVADLVGFLVDNESDNNYKSCDANTPEKSSILFRKNRFKVTHTHIQYRLIK